MALTQINKAGLDEIALDHVFTIGASGSSAYTFQGEGLNGTVNNPTLYLTRGKTYRFENGSGGHPIRIQSTSGASGTAYNTGVTNNAGSGTVIVEVQHDAPDVLYYQCTSHAAMNGILYITGALADGGVTTAKLADDAVNNDKLANSVVASIAANTAKTTNATHTGDVTGSTSLTIANGAVTEAKLATNAVTTDKINSGVVTNAKLAANAVGTANIADEAVTLAKLPHGTSSNNGKFLRANNGADPTFETVSGTTINNNANNKVITGSNTANTLEAESDLIYNGSQLLVNTDQEAPFTSRKLTVANTGSGDACAIEIRSANNGTGRLYFTDSHLYSGSDAGSYAGKVIYDHTTDHMGFYTGGDTSTPSEKLKIQANGNLDVVNGNLSFASGHGIDFSATGDASGATNELLDDYEEGSFTPSFNMTSSSPNITYYDQQGQYTKVGRVVHFQIYLRINVVNSNGSGILFVDGLPYTPVSNTGQGPAFGCVSFGYMDTLQGYNGTDSPVGYVEANANRIYLYLFPDSSGHAVNLTVANNLANNSKMMMAGSYQV